MAEDPPWMLLALAAGGALGALCLATAVIRGCGGWRCRTRHAGQQEDQPTPGSWAQGLANVGSWRTPSTRPMHHLQPLTTQGSTPKDTEQWPTPPVLSRRPWHLHQRQEGAYSSPSSPSPQGTRRSKSLTFATTPESVRPEEAKVTRLHSGTTSSPSQRRRRSASESSTGEEHRQGVRLNEDLLQNRQRPGGQEPGALDVTIG